MNQTLKISFDNNHIYALGFEKKSISVFGLDKENFGELEVSIKFENFGQKIFQGGLGDYELITGDRLILVSKTGDIIFLKIDFMKKNGIFLGKDKLDLIESVDKEEVYKITPCSKNQIFLIATKFEKLNQMCKIHVVWGETLTDPQNYGNFVVNYIQEIDLRSDKYPLTRNIKFNSYINLDSVKKHQKSKLITEIDDLKEMASFVGFFLKDEKLILRVFEFRKDGLILEEKWQKEIEGIFCLSDVVRLGGVLSGIDGFGKLLGFDILYL